MGAGCGVNAGRVVLEVLVVLKLPVVKSAGEGGSKERERGLKLQVHFHVLDAFDVEGLVDSLKTVELIDRLQVRLSFNLQQRPLGSWVERSRALLGYLKTSLQQLVGDTISA